MKLKTTVATLLGLAIINGCGSSSSENEELSGGTSAPLERTVDTISMAYQEGDRGSFDLNLTKVSNGSTKLVFEPIIGESITLLTAQGKGTVLLACLPVADTIDGDVKIVCNGIGPDANGDTVNVSYTIYLEKNMVHLVRTQYSSTPTYGKVAYELTAEDLLQVKITKR